MRGSIVPPIITSAVKGGEMSGSCPGQFTTISHYLLNKRLVGLQSLARIQTLDHPVCSFVTALTVLSLP